jgi:DHA3 family tetracycline resistance protein-like MFS transporter
MMKKRALNIYLTYSFLQNAFFWMTFTVDSIYMVVTVGLDPLQLVLIGTTVELSILLLELPTGIVADLYSRKLSIIIGIFLIGAGMILQGSWPMFVPILAAQLLWGLGYTFTSGSVQAWISDEIGEEQANSAFVRGAQMEQYGGFTGILVGATFGVIALQLSIILSGIFFLALGCFLIWRMPETNFHPHASSGISQTAQSIIATFRSGIGMIKKRPILIRILLIGFFFGLYSEGYDRLWVAHLLERFTFPNMPEVIWIGVINAAGFLLSAAALEFVKRRLYPSGTNSLVRFLAISSTALILSLASFALSGLFSLAILFVWIIDILRNVINPLYIGWVNRKLDSKIRATVISMAGQVDAIGQVAGGPGVGLIARRFSIQTGILSTSTLLLPVLFLFAPFLLPGRSKEVPEEVKVE